jgi:hypothetical protein
VAPAVPKETAPTPQLVQPAPHAGSVPHVQSAPAVAVQPAQPYKPLATATYPRVEVLEPDADILGLNDLFKPPVEAPPVLSVSDEEIERIADRVIQKLSTQVIESVAWDVVPEITAKVLREELKRQS